MTKLSLKGCIEMANEKYNVKMAINYIFKFLAFYIIGGLAVFGALNIVSALNGIQLISTNDYEKNVEEILSAVKGILLISLGVPTVGTGVALLIERLVGKIGLIKLAKYLSKEDIKLTSSDLKKAEVVTERTEKSVATNIPEMTSKETNVTNIAFIPSKSGKTYVATETISTRTIGNDNNTTETGPQLLDQTEAEVWLNGYPKIADKVRTMKPLHKF